MSGRVIACLESVVQHFWMSEEASLALKPNYCELSISIPSTFYRFHHKLNLIELILTEHLMD